MDVYEYTLHKLFIGRLIRREHRTKRITDTKRKTKKTRGCKIRKRKDRHIGDKRHRQPVDMPTKGSYYKKLSSNKSTNS